MNALNFLKDELNFWQADKPLTSSDLFHLIDRALRREREYLYKKALEEQNGTNS